jgi:hypothetical protein
MTPVVLASILLTIPFLVAFIGIPLWIKRPETSADHIGAHRYLRARSARTHPVIRAAAARAALAPAAA